MLASAVEWRIDKQRNIAGEQRTLEILQGGLIESDDQLMELTERHRQLVIPNDEDLELTNWWVITEDGADVHRFRFSPRGPDTSVKSLLAANDAPL